MWGVFLLFGVPRVAGCGVSARAGAGGKRGDRGDRGGAGYRVCGRGRALRLRSTVALGSGDGSKRRRSSIDGVVHPATKEVATDSASVLIGDSLRYSVAVSTTGDDFVLFI